ncbi:MULTISPECIES: hypothetical protein [unclassified Streptomyces]|uniref:hypothetical protein n=1 Tax=unclassified Streptomyces TaxID=2593676 RepID=UPI000823D34D|nr:MULTISPECIES: hypothetical protein [unclassified Streptomyces]SCK21861.1 hypothetical protein YW7DRAFT_01612 [Streptomyces sp. AmelKG-E11A]
MDLNKQMSERAQQGPAREAEGRLAVAVRLPVRIVVLVLVVPVRLLWDALVAGGVLLNRAVLRPVGRGLAVLGRVLVVTPLNWCVRWILVPLGRGALWALKGLWAGCAWLLRFLVAVPAKWLYAAVLTPLGRGLARAADGAGVGLLWVLRVLVVVPVSWLWTWVLAPVGKAVGYVLVKGARGIGIGLYWTLRVLLYYPALGLWRWLLAPVGRGLAVVGREVGDAFGHAWRIAGRISRAVGRFLGGLLRLLLVGPAVRFYRAVCVPVGHAVRDTLWRPAARLAREAGRATRQALGTVRDTARQTRADIRRAFSGARRERVAVAVPAAAREPVSGPTAGPLAGPARVGAPGDGRYGAPLAPAAASAHVPRPVPLSGPGAGVPGCAVAGGSRATGSGPREPGGDPRRTLGSSTTALTKD